MSYANKEWYLSSSGNGDLSTTLKGVLNAFIPMLVIVGGKYGLDISENDIVELVSAVWGAVAAIQIAFGLVRKVYLKIRVAMNK